MGPWITRESNVCRSGDLRYPVLPASMGPWITRESNCSRTRASYGVVGGFNGALDNQGIKPI